MSNSMLEQAIIDAETLKEAAVKNAEQAIVEKYSADIKKAVNQLLEQEEDPMAMEDTPEEETEFQKEVNRILINENIGKNLKAAANVTVRLMDGKLNKFDIANKYALPNLRITTKR